MLAAQIDMRQQGPVIRGHADTGTVKDMRLRDFRRGRGQHAVERQKGPVDREGRFDRAAQICAQKPLGQRKAAPRAPFVQIADQNGGLARLAKNILADGAQLRPAQGLHQRQMRADEAKRLPITRQISDDSTAMAASGQIKQGDAVDRDMGPDKNDRAQKSVAVIRPAMRGVAVQIAQAGGGLDCRDIQQAIMWWDLFISLLQDQRVDLIDRHFGLQGGKCPVGGNASVIAAAAVDVPAQAGKVLISIGQYLAFAGGFMALGPRNDSLMFKQIDMIGEINVCS
ncbi:hypothetical protein BC777_3489 [Yoonia maricola]|uniref:Uncharacterized protein n=1 Tax=Yoonia maricola TaxID=420999 RepID=A0A2M8W0H8_9RHOB|nr:hypothetical protein BC777_3489 [Yoonia maricola]